MTFFSKKFFVTLLIFFSINSLAQNSYKIEIQTRTENLPFGLEEEVPVEAAKVGYALSGGGARGLAQIGVLKALEEAGIFPDVVVGTSIGSIVGGLYAAGYSVDQLDSLANSTDWYDLVSPGSETNRRELFVDQKITEDRAVLTLRLDGLNPVIPTSFNDGIKLSNYLSLLCFSAPIISNKNFDDLLYKYRAVCTDLITGNEVIINKGSLSRAMRASSSVTFFLAPVQTDSLTLVDGGLTANIPVIPAKKEGAEYIIAINTTSPLHQQNELDLPWIVADQTVSIPMKKLDERQLREANVIINPDLVSWETTDFENIQELIDQGYNSAKQNIPEIKKDLDSLLQEKLGEPRVYFHNIEIDTSADDFLLEKTRYLEKKDSVSNIEIKKELIKIYTSGRYKKIDAGVITFPNKSILKFNYEPYPLVNKITIISSPELTSALDSSQAERLIGKPYNNRNLVRGIIRILNNYKSKGFLLAEFREHKFVEETGELILTFKAGIISNINIHSNTNKTVITREFPVKEGSVFKYDDLARGLDNLRSTRFFEDINVCIEKNDSENILDINLREKVSSLLKLGFLVDNVYNAQLSLDIREENLFSTGTELGLFILAGARTRAYVLDHIAYRVLNTYLTYNINAFYKFNDISTYSRIESSSRSTFSSQNTGRYRQIFYGASLSIGTQIEKFGKLIFKGKYQIDEIKNKENMPVTPDKTKIVSLRIATVIDNQNKYPYPTDGLYLNGFYETAQSLFGGDEGFLMVGLDMKYYYSIKKAHVIFPRIQIGFADKTLPLSEHFSMGGQYSFFGLHENEQRGRQIFITSCTYQYKLPFKIFFDTYLSFRYDLGATWAVQENIRFKDLMHGIGGTLSFDTPVGPADFSVGRSFLLNKNLPKNPVSWGDVLFYFSIGYALNF